MKFLGDAGTPPPEKTIRYSLFAIFYSPLLQFFGSAGASPSQFFSSCVLFPVPLLSLVLRPSSRKKSTLIELVINYGLMPVWMVSRFGDLRMIVSVFVSAVLKLTDGLEWRKTLT